MYSIFRRLIEDLYYEMHTLGIKYNALSARNYFLSTNIVCIIAVCSKQFPAIIIDGRAFSNMVGRMHLFDIL